MSLDNPTWHCSICNTDIRKVHKARHLRSIKHQALDRLTYETTDSDIHFTRFLQGFDPRRFKGVELKIYQEFRGTKK